MLHAFKRRKCYTPLKNGCYQPGNARNQKPAEIWIACNPVALTNRDPHGFDLPSGQRLATNMPHTRRAQPTPVVQEQPRGRSVPRAPHPLLTSLASRPDSGDVSVLTRILIT